MESIGSNNLIKEGAFIYLKTEQLLLNVRAQPEYSAIESNKQLLNLDAIEAKILKVLTDKCISVDEVLDLIDEDGGTIIEKISIMELEGKIMAMPGGRISANVF